MTMTGHQCDYTLKLNAISILWRRQNQNIFPVHHSINRTLQHLQLSIMKNITEEESFHVTKGLHYEK